jgi:hypothetical protein
MGLEHAGTITAPSWHPLEILAARATCSIAGRTVFLPNAGFVEPEAAINHASPISFACRAASGKMKR